MLTGWNRAGHEGQSTTPRKHRPRARTTRAPGACYHPAFSRKDDLIEFTTPSAAAARRVTPPRPIDSLDAGIFAAIRGDAGHFPPTIQSRGRGLLAAGRVGPLEFEAGEIRALVRGTHTHRTAWRWDGRHADPHCSCPAGPVCSHAYALALAIGAAQRAAAAGVGGEAVVATDAAHAGDAQDRDAAQEALGGTADPALDPSPGALAEDLALWARRHAGSPSRALRAVFGLDADAAHRPLVWMEARLTTARQTDAPRTAQQLYQLASDLQRDPRGLSPPHARLLRILSRILPHLEPLPGGARFGLRASALNRILDNFSDSALAVWGEGQAAALTRGGVTPGQRLRLNDQALDVVPAFSGAEADMQIQLAARWPDGRQRSLEEIFYMPSDDELHPSLVLAEGAFWRVAEEPPTTLMRRFALTGNLPVPESGRERFLELLATSFSSVGDALAPHTRVHRARAAVTLDLGADDWMQVRLFAHTGDDAWRPGQGRAGIVSFEWSGEGQWLRMDSVSIEPDTERERVGEMETPASIEEGAPPVQAAEPASDPEATWIELPEPAPLEPARLWLVQLPLVQRDEAGTSSDASAADRSGSGGWMRLGSRNLKAFADAWDRRPRGVTFLGNPRVRDLLGESRAIRPRLSVVASGVDWFTVSAEWHAEGLALTEADLNRLRTARTPFVKLASGWVRRDLIQQYEASAETLADLGIEAGAGEQRLTLAQLAQARPESLAALEQLGGDPAAIRGIQQLRERVRAFAGLPRVKLPARLEATLRPYQRDGLDFLAFVSGLGMGAVLADDMGLGKTVQALAWIEYLRERDPEGGPVLVVCPTSVIHNWQREAERFTPHLKVLALTSGEERHALRREVPHHDLVVTNYALLRRDIEHWRSIRLRAAILDEAQYIKNPGTAAARAVQALDARHRLALTGTPLENRALDLWSIMQFVNPGYLGTRGAFVRRYDTPHSAAHARRLLAARLRPVMVRRLKEQVAPDLPDRIEERRECELTPGQRKLYLAELMRGRETVARLKASADGIARNKIEVLAALTRLRQVCCHPALVGGRESLGSGKFEALFEILEPLLAEGRKVLVFSQFVECLKLLADEMKRRAIRYHMLTGATTRREAVVTGFETDPEPCVFLISLKAGGQGLNLTAASYVVLFDPWWNPAVEAQAIDRAHRIGQTRTVIAFRMLAAGTIEEKIWELQQRKATLVAEVLGEDGFARTLTQQDLDYLLG